MDTVGEALLDPVNAECRVEVCIHRQWWHWKDITTANIEFHLDRLRERYPNWKWRENGRYSVFI